MNHTINVSIDAGGRVSANPNPLPLRGPDRTEVKTGETVTWSFPQENFPQLMVKFKSVGPAPQHPNPINPGVLVPTTTPLGPFISVTISAGKIVGTIGPGVPTTVPGAQRFLYDLFDLATGIPVPWRAPANDGGIDIPRTPP